MENKEMVEINSEDDSLFVKLLEYIFKQNPGTKLPSIIKLSEMFGSSPSRIRKGLIRAELIGAITVSSRSGCYTKKIDGVELFSIFGLIMKTAYFSRYSSVLNIYELKSMIDIGVARKISVSRTDNELLILRDIIMKQEAADKVSEQMKYDEQFHFEIVKCAGNDVLSAIYSIIQSSIRKTRLNSMSYSEHYQQSIKEHKQLFTAIMKKDVNAATEIAEYHTLNKQKQMLENSFEE
jgi:DNA-binding FadR family transcriptional regulator